MSTETVKLLGALLSKAVTANWLPREQAEKVWEEVNELKTGKRKKVKSPELGT